MGTDCRQLLRLGKLGIGRLLDGLGGPYSDMGIYVED